MRIGNLKRFAYVGSTKSHGPGSGSTPTTQRYVLVITGLRDTCRTAGSFHRLTANVPPVKPSEIQAGQPLRAVCMSACKVGGVVPEPSRHEMYGDTPRVKAVRIWTDNRVESTYQSDGLGPQSQIPLLQEPVKSGEMPALDNLAFYHALSCLYCRTQPGKWRWR